MLNSAAGVTLPSKEAPPINTTRSTRPSTPPWRSSNVARLVSGPIATIVSGPSSINPASTSTACLSLKGTSGSSHSRSLKPSLP
jgi:hypothetical protein